MVSDELGIDGVAGDRPQRLTCVTHDQLVADCKRTAIEHVLRLLTIRLIESSFNLFYTLCQFVYLLPRSLQGTNS